MTNCMHVVPGAVNFITQLDQSIINVTWQVRIKYTTIIILLMCAFFSQLIFSAFTDSWFPSPSLCSVL